MNGADKRQKARVTKRLGLGCAILVLAVVGTWIAAWLSWPR